jgi:hypothetical protein
LQPNDNYIRPPDALDGLRKLNSVAQIAGSRAIIEVVRMPRTLTPCICLIVTEMLRAVSHHAG